MEVKSLRATVVLGCDCCLSDTDESHSALDAADFEVERFDVTPKRDLGLLRNHVCF